MDQKATIGLAVDDANTLDVVRWPHGRAEHSGHDTRSAYVERFWLSTLGPTTILFLRHCAELLDEVDRASVNLCEVASALGIGFAGGQGGQMSRTLARACRFKAAKAVGPATLAVRRTLPELTSVQVQRLPAALQDRHREFMSSGDRGDVISHQRMRARRLALSLIECGDGIGEAEVQLARLRLHPALAADAVRWAWSQHHRRLPPEPTEVVASSGERVGSSGAI